MRLFIIANRLPVKVNRNQQNQIEFIRSEGGLTTGLDSLVTQMEKHWIGWPGTYAESDEEKESIRHHLQALDFHPVFLSQEQILNYYEGYCNSTLWPLCHYFYAFMKYDKAYWEAYQQVNRIFADAIAALAEPGDVIWVHDYHLMLLPQLVRQSVADVSIGYFHHIPFPSYELFRVLPGREQLLQGLLAADLIGFHTHDYMRHFVSATERVLDINFQTNRVMFNNNIAYVNNFPMGINYELYNSAALLPEVREKTKKLRENFKQHKIILSVDRLDYSKGILHRLKGFAQFLKNHPEHHGKVSMAMIVVPSRSNVDRYADLKAKIDELIGTINGRFSDITWTPVYYFYHAFNFEELVAFYNISDIALVTPLRDGMNLVAKEFVAAKRNKPGVLILSEMAGASIELRDALIINPNNVSEIENALLVAFEMPEKEQLERLDRMQKLLSKKTIEKWAAGFMKELLAVKSKNEAHRKERIDIQSKRKIQTDYRNASHRLLILDYDGTLSGFKSQPEEAVPTSEIYRLLEHLMSDPKNKVAINSGRDYKTLEKWFGHLPLSLAAEHGAYYKERGVWNSRASGEKLWDSEIPEIMKAFVERTPRSAFEEKKLSLVWHYRNVDNWLASLREQQLFEELIVPCSAHDLQIMRGNKIIEVKSPRFTKGAEVQHLLATGDYDFILAIGDDTTDEDTFRALPESACTIKVGNASKYARYNVRWQTRVIPLLRFISG